MQHAVPIAVAVAIPAVLGSSSPGLAALPLMFIASYRLRAPLFRNYFLLPLVAAAVLFLERRGQLGGGVPALLEPVLPVVIAVTLHYLLVYFAKRAGRAGRESIDNFCSSFSAYLDNKCYKTKTLPTFLYMKAERVLVALACIFKIALSIAYMVLFPIFVGIPQDAIGCSGKENQTASMWAWFMFMMVASTEIAFHMAMFLSNQVKTNVMDSFSLPVLCPTYWQWYFIAQYHPTSGIWLPITIECIRNCSVSFFRMQDKEDTLVSPMASIVDMLHGFAVTFGVLGGACVFPLAMLYRQLSNGAIFVIGYISMRYKKYKTWAKANTPIACRLYIPIHHKEIECFQHAWRKDLKLGKGRTVPYEHEKYGMCTVTYLPELVLERTEKKPDFNDPTLSTFISFTRKTKLPGEWIRIDVPKKAGLLLSPTEMDTGLVGQFRVLHPLLDSKGVLKHFGNFSGKLFAAKRYKKDPAGGWDMIDLDEAGVAALSEAEKSAAINRQMRLLKPYFQDCLMQEKAAEFGRAFNRVENLPVRKVEVLRAVVMEIKYDTEFPELFLVEQFLDDSVPFRKFNNNDYVPGAQAVQNTPNMLSLFSYFHSDKKLVMCDIQGKKYRFTDPQFHSNDPMIEDDDFYDEEDEGRDWLHSDGGLEMQKRVLVGLHKQTALHTLCNRIWPEAMQKFNEEVEEWMQDEDFVDVLRELEKQAKMYATYFNNLNPVMDATIGGPYVDADEELDRALKSGPEMSFDSDGNQKKKKK